MGYKSQIRVLRKVLANNFALSDAEDNNYGLWNRGGKADLSLLITLLAINQKSQEPSFWEVMDSFALVAYANLAASRNLSQKIYFAGTNEKSDFYELWQQHKLLKNIKISEF